MKYKLVVEEVMKGTDVELPDGAKLPNLSEPNELGVCELTYLEPKESEKVDLGEPDDSLWY